MRTIVLAGLLAIHAKSHGGTIGLWDFNSTPPDASAATGSTAPAVGLGTALVVGGVTATFAAGSGSDTGADNTGWSTAGYPAVAAANKTAGVQFRVSTTGYTNIAVTWDQRVSGSASRHSRFQYSINGTDFIDGPVFSMPSNNTYYVRSVSLGSASAVNNNGSFAFRIVSEFESTATGAGTNAYVTALGGSYSAAGTIRFDGVRVTGNPLNPGNTPPTIEPVPDLATLENQPITGYPLHIGDDGTPAPYLIVRAASANTNLIPSSSVQIHGTDYRREMTITPTPGLFGQARITLTVIDAEALMTAISFLVTVAPANVPPVISAIPHQRQVMGASGSAIAFVVDDTETPAGNLRVSADSSDPALIGTDGLVLGGSDRNRTLRLVPAPGRMGTALITVRVEDEGGRVDATRFVVSVVPTESALAAESFGYADGPLVDRSGGYWATHAGTTGQVQVAGGSIGLSTSRTEDVHLALPGNSIESGVVFARFDVRFTSLPSGSEYFAHWNHATAFRARILASTNNAARGAFRLAVGNGGSGGLGEVARDLSLDTTYTVVMRYDVAAASSALWVDPEGESATPALATDAATALPISSFSLRNASGIGAIQIDNLWLGRTFADVAGNAAPGVTLAIERPNHNEVEISWPASLPGYRLQSNAAFDPAGWSDEAQVPSVSGGRNVVRLPAGGLRRVFRLIQ